MNYLIFVDNKFKLVIFIEKLLVEINQVSLNHVECYVIKKLNRQHRKTIIDEMT